MKTLHLLSAGLLLLLQLTCVCSQGGPDGGLNGQLTMIPQVLVPGNNIYKLNFTSTLRPDFLVQNQLAALGAIAFTAGPLPPHNVSWLGIAAIHTTKEGVVWSLGTVEIQVKACPAPLCRNSTDLKFWLDLDFNQRLAVHGILKGSWSVRAAPGSPEPPILTTLAPGHSLGLGGGGPDGGAEQQQGGQEGSDSKSPPTGGDGQEGPISRPPKPHLRVHAQITTTLSLEEAQTDAKKAEIREDIAEACNVPAENVTITSIRAGSVIVEFEIETTNYDNDTEVLSQLMNATQTGDLAAYTTGNQTVTILVTVIVNQTPSPVIIVERENTTAIVLVVVVGLLLVVVVVIASIVMVITIKKQGRKRSRTKRIIVTPVEEFEGDSNPEDEDGEHNPIAAAPASTVVEASSPTSTSAQQQQQHILMMQQQMMMIQQQAQLQAQLQQQQLQHSTTTNNSTSVAPPPAKSGGTTYYGMSSSSGSGSNANMNSFGSNGFGTGNQS